MAGAVEAAKEMISLARSCAIFDFIRVGVEYWGDIG